MKYVVILGDGMADYRQSFLDNKTPLMVANKPFIDSLAKVSEVGLCQTVPCSLKPGSDVANLSVLGYNPLECYSGRSPLEAASIGIALKDTDITARANLVTLSNEKEYADKTMIDYSAGEITTAEATELIGYLASHLNNDKYSLYAGISYRHCMVIDNGSLMGDLTPPHDITGKPIKEHLPTSEGGKELLEIMKKSYELLSNHPINKKRIEEGKNPANSLWFWGDGTKPNLESFYDKFSLKGGIISAVDLLKGIGKLAKMQVIEVEGATGNYDTNFVGKANACVEGLKNGLDFVYLHMEAPDECGHHGDAKNKIYSIEQIDNVVKIIYDGLKEMGEDFAFLILPDHPTPLSIMTHCSDPVPYLLYNSKNKVKGVQSYDEQNASDTKIFEKEGYKLIQKLFNC
ncbi:MAG: cofactor-independent phosphoglycerate mutase [Clostridiales bacterium]|nr:cofactor-independent phosphoglycerate mutase [Clostridiales bacterium]